jgi:cytochrome P450
MQSRNAPPGPRGMFATIRHYQRDMLGFFQDCAHRYGDLALIRFPLDKLYLLNRPELIKQLLLDYHDHGVKTWTLKQFDFMVGNGILLSEGAFWRQQRRQLQPAFHNDRIRRYGRSMVTQAQAMLDGWEEGATLDLHREMSQVTLKVVAETLFGLKLTHQVQLIGDLMHLAMDSFDRQMLSWLPVPLNWPLPQHWRLHLRARRIKRLAREVMAARRGEGCEGDDLLSWLLSAQAENGMSDAQIRDELLTLLIAGYETTANSLSWTLMLLAQHPEVLAKLRAEVDQVLGARSPEPEDVPQLSYARQVVQESMRLYPPVWMTGRTVTKPFVLDGYTIPRGAMVLVSQYITHRDPRYFPEPELFRPERWAQEPQPPKYAYFPFGGGPRFCIGSNFAMMEAVLILATIVQRQDWELVPGHPIELRRRSPCVRVTASRRWFGGGRFAGRRQRSRRASRFPNGGAGASARTDPPPAP